MAYLVSFHNAIQTVIGTAWPELIGVEATGIYRDLELATFTDLQRKSAANTLPLAVFTLSLEEGEWGLTNRTHEGLLTILYVNGDETDLDTMLGKLETLRDLLFADTLTVGQVLTYPRVLESVASPALQSFFASVQRPFVAGAVTCRVTVGETAA